MTGRECRSRSVNFFWSGNDKSQMVKSLNVCNRSKGDPMKGEIIAP
jgi:hypothetical protein